MSLHVAHHFDDAEQQFDAAKLGMWLFLATEILFFGGMFLGYAVYRYNYAAAFAEGSSHLHFWLGTINTAVLLCSSLTIALAVRSSQLNDARGTVRLLVATSVLGLVFLGIKGYEYYDKITNHQFPGEAFVLTELHNPEVNPNHVELFYSIYFAMTGFHALHMVIGVGLVGYVGWLANQGRFSAEYYTPMEMTGLYWHFVDIVWVFLYPLLYLIG